MSIKADETAAMLQYPFAVGDKLALRNPAIPVAVVVDVRDVGFRVRWSVGGDDRGTEADFTWANERVSRNPFKRWKDPGEHR